MQKQGVVQPLCSLWASPIVLGSGKMYMYVQETDATTVGLGAVLYQTQEDKVVHPIAYASSSVNKHKRNYRISEVFGRLMPLSTTFSQGSAMPCYRRVKRRGCAQISDSLCTTSQFEDGIHVKVTGFAKFDISICNIFSRINPPMTLCSLFTSF